MDRERITELLFQLGFEAIVSEGRGTADRVSSLVSDEPAHVQAAWAEVIGRMLSMEPIDCATVSRPRAPGAGAAGS